METPFVDVGILCAPTINFELHQPFVCLGAEACGRQEAEWRDGKVYWNGQSYPSLTFMPSRPEARFTLSRVMIGIQFHWQRYQTLQYVGTLALVATADGIQVINRLPVEDYLCSVVSSEMRATASLEFLKAHAVISRSWLLTNLRSHEGFDVCADDHCQRYQGIGMVTNPTAVQAVRETAGEVLTYQDAICDTRYSKCCGGRTELFSTCWEDRDYHYLQPVDCPFCHTSDAAILSQVLNAYDQETTDFHDWTVRYGVEELSALVARKTGIDFGQVVALEPLHRGPSGRISQLRIVGTRQSHVVGKELNIRKALSESHLLSSAFRVEREAGSFVLHGRGWGHGVGLCQIGAAVMGAQGYSYREILSHYYKDAEIRKQY